MFTDKTLMITGGTGSFGNAVIQKFLHSDIKEIRIVSRDEKKQHDMMLKYRNDKIKFYIADIRDLEALRSCMENVDLIFHAAALKQVPNCEFFPFEAVKTNIIGAENVLTSAREAGVKKVICLSTDKAVYPVNAMGMTKALMEKLFMAKARQYSNNGMTICGTRYGNVMASRGSIIPLFIEQIKSGVPLTLTAPYMTRFMMSLEEAVLLVEHTFLHGQNGDIFVQKAPACTVETLAKALLQIFETDNELKTIGVRHGEKDHEVLLTKEEMAVAVDMGRYYRIPLDMRDRYYTAQDQEINQSFNAAVDYNSFNAERYDVDQMTQLLMKLDYVKEQL